MKPHCEDILGYEVDKRGVAECIRDMLRSIEAGQQARWVACLNPHVYAVAVSDQVFAGALRGADWLVPDGVGVVLASRVFGGAIQRRVTGSDNFRGVQEGLDRLGNRSVFLLGSKEETLAAMKNRMAREFPRVRVAGSLSPSFSATFSKYENDYMVDAVNAAAPDVLWVGMTAPKQEKWIFDNRARLKVKLAGAIGAVFDFYSGRIKRSHPAFQGLGLEWLPRLLREPRRLWMRTFVSAPIFAWHVLRRRMRGQPGPSNQ